MITFITFVFYLVACFDKIYIAIEIKYLYKVDF